MKRCKVCERVLPLDAFGREPRNLKDGRTARCRECENARLRDYYATHPEKRRESVRRSKRTERYRSQIRALYHSGDPAVRARLKLGKAVRSGRLVRPDVCSECGESGLTHGHHDDYSKPYDVRWLCGACHAATHGRVLHV